MSLTTPFRGAVTVLEVVTPNPLVSKKRKEVSSSTVPDKSWVLGSPWIFIRPRRSQVFFFITDKGISLLLALFTSLNGTDGEKESIRRRLCVQNVWAGDKKQIMRKDQLIN